MEQLHSLFAQRFQTLGLKTPSENAAEGKAHAAGHRHRRQRRFHCRPAAGGTHTTRIVAAEQSHDFIHGIHHKSHKSA